MFFMMAGSFAALAFLLMDMQKAAIAALAAGCLITAAAHL